MSMKSTSIKEFLKRKNVNITVQTYLIDALGAMAFGLFASLLIGTIFGTLGQQFGIGIYFLSKEAKKHVTVVLSGEGADELFGGYNIYKEYKSIKPIFNMPNSMKSILNTASTVMPNIKGKNYLYRATTPLEKRYIGNAKIFDDNEIKKVLKFYNKVDNHENLLANI